MPSVTLLGPQSPASNLRAALDRLNVDGPLVSVTAGWREREGEIDELVREVGRPVVDLELFERANAVFESDQSLHQAVRARQDTLKEMQRLYRLRLRHVARAAYELLGARGTAQQLQSQQRAAIAQIRTLDRHHLKRIEKSNALFNRTWAPLERPALQDHLLIIRRRIEQSAGILLAGGHVAVLLNRLRLFGLDKLLHQHTVVGWSAGAMVLGQQIVLYHDRAPEGRRDAEVLDVGLGRVNSVVALPDAEQRLDRDDRLWLALFARRFSPAKCMTLNAGSFLHYDDDGLREAGQVSRLSPQGRLRQVRGK